jgi:hypothetical protein
MADPLEVLRQKKALLRQKAEDAARQAQEVDHDLQELERILSKHGLALAAVESAAQSQQRRPNEPDPTSLTRRARAAAAAVIRAAGQPVPLGELYAKVIERGVTFGGGSPKKAFCGYISHSGTLISIEGRGWWFADQPIPESGARIWSPPVSEPARAASKRSQIEAVVAAYLNRERRRATSGELAKILVSAGFSLGEQPGKQLSSFLSRSRLFDNNPERGGYGLVEWSVGTANNNTEPSDLLKAAKALAGTEEDDRRSRSI